MPLLREEQQRTEQEAGFVEGFLWGGAFQGGPGLEGCGGLILGQVQGLVRC